MMNRYLQLLLVFFLSGSAHAQNYGNEWIEYSQKYFAFNVYQTGIHRIDQSALVANNVPVGTFASENIQIFGRQREIPILIVDGNDNSMDPGDYILFFAEKNDGWLDSLVYTDPTHIANPGYSLYNDTIQYFFTWNDQTTNKRFIIDPDTEFGTYGSPANYVLKDIESACANISTGYSEGNRLDDAAGSVFAPGEGWGCYSATLATPQNNILMATYEAYSGADAPLSTIHFSVTSASNAPYQNPDHHLQLQVSNSLTLTDTVFESYQQIKQTKTFPASLISSPFTFLQLNCINDLGAAADILNLTYWKLRYARSPIYTGQTYDDFWVENNPDYPKTQVNLQSLPATNAIAFSFGSANYALTTQLNGGSWQFLVPNNPSNNTTRVVIGDLSVAITITQLEAVNGSGQFTDFSALSAEGAVIMVYHPILQSATANYANYRSSLAGGGHNVVLANINELYQQYGGGVEKHILGIRRFAHHLYDLTSQKPKGLFLLGKGLSEYLSNAPQFSTRFNPGNFAASLIPSFGHPSSDIAITAGLNGTQWDPLIPTGRIAAKSNEELQNYLNKVIQYESQQVQNDPNNYTTATKDWQKQILHFVGGSDQQQQLLFRSYMDTMKKTIEDSLFAANVTSYYKNSSDPLDPTVISGVTERISNGVSIMNFFGHAAASNNGFEINIDEPANWNNQGKYPVVIGNSCYNGNIFGTGVSTSEKFVNTSDAGAIAFISSVSVGYDYPLALYSGRLYGHFSKFSYGETIGEQMRRTILYSQIALGNNLLSESTCMQMALHGDPMLRVNWHQRPEIEISAQNMYFEPTALNLTVDSIELNLIITNLGRSVLQPFKVEIRRDFPGTTTDSVYTLTLPHLHYKDTIHFKMPMQPNIGVGINKFSILVDIPSEVAEQAEEVNNNQIVYDYFVNVDGILPVYPYDFAVIPYDSVTVRASTINPIANLRTYLFELDTTDTYDSPQLRRFSITDVGGVKEVRPDQWRNAGGGSFPLVCTDSTVYFWRVAIDSSILNWVEYSFQYIEGKSGWGQDHFFQFKKNDFYNLTYNRVNRLREFSPPDTHWLEINAYDNPTLYNLWTFDGEIQDYSCKFYGAPAVYVCVLDPITLLPWGTRYLNQNSNHAFGNGNDNPDGADLTICPTCRPTGHENYFAFEQSDPAQLSALQNMLENEIPDGYYVGIYTVVATQYSNWDTYQPGLYTTFQNLGSTLVNNSQPEKPFAMFYQKGDPSTLIEKHYPDTLPSGQGPYVKVVGPVFTTNYTGIERTPLIGPAMNWETAYWKRDSLELSSTDSVRLYIEAHDISGALQMTIDTLFTPNDSILQLNNLVDANVYPYLRLGVYCSDGLFLTPAQVARLHILYQPVPEAAIDGTSAYLFSPHQDTLQEGQQISFAIDIRNVSDFNMDSLLVQYWVEDINRVKHPISYPRQGPLTANDTLRDTVQFSTQDMAGLNSLWMEVNPYVNGSTFITDQPEQFHFNNLLQIPFLVKGDDVQPILDVTFDGNHILNGDIISPESEILITLKDDNPYLIMDDISDTTLFGIYLTDPSGVQRRIPFLDGSGNVVMQWIPADAQNKKFKIIYPSLFEQNGVYTLFVQGTDRSGNVSGDIEYRISFEIVRESSITYMMNYPNPFSTSTRFIFTLTGSEVPDDMIIQIMTVTGRVVREITEAEIGPITIGRNITEFAWDGTDEFGDPLANGVYLYRVKAKINGEDIKHRESGADSHFKKEFGKMYLMR